MVGAQLTLLDSHAVKAGEFTLRPYQDAADSAVDRELLTKRSTLVVHATGLGKTVLFSSQALKRGGALVLAHRDSLIEQAAAKLQQATGIARIAIEKAERTAFACPYICASVQTLKGPRLKRFAQRFPDLRFIVIDEAHRATADSYRAILAAFPNAKVLGVTATADRTDGVGLGNVFESVAHRFEIREGTDAGWLTPFRYWPVKSNINLDAIKVVGNKTFGADFKQEELDDAVGREAGKIARAILDSIEQTSSIDPSVTRATRLIGFAPGVKTAHAVAAALNELRPGCADAVDGNMLDETKNDVFKRHRAGAFQYLMNVGVLTEGYDDATLGGIFDAAPTKSRLRYTQKAGRATRLWPEGIHTLATNAERLAAIAASPKPHAHLFDLVTNGERHELIGPVDLLAGDELPTVRKEAKKILRERGGDPEDALKLARERARQAVIASKATKVTVGPPRSVFERTGAKFLGTQGGRQANRKMIYLLIKRGIPYPKNCTERQFRRLLGKDQEREDKGMCRLGGVEWLRARGHDAWKWTSEQATRVRDEIKRSGFSAIPPERLAALLERTPGED